MRQVSVTEACMSNESAFLAAIAAAPEDDTARLVFADWLDEHGSRGAEFIRAEYELAAQPIGFPLWHEAFARYQKAGEGLAEQWRTAVGRYPLAHWLAISARSAWTRLERWCQNHHPRLLATLNPGASAAEIEAVEQAIGQTLQSDVRESFAIHNGASERFVLGDSLLSTQSVITQWQKWRGLEDHNEEFRDSMESFPPNAVALDYANSGWLPLAQSGGSDYLGVDLAPGTAGTVGQVINFGRDEHHKCVLASNWAEFLADFSTFLESGAVSVIDPDPSIWIEACSAALERTHCHDMLRTWRKEGRWPLSNPAT
jgi:uncharacterized protein (TIGR02996 family)